MNEGRKGGGREGRKEEGKEGRREGRKGRKEEGWRKEGWRKEGRKDGKSEEGKEGGREEVKDGSKEGGREGRKERRRQGGKEGGKKGREGGRQEKSKEGVNSYYSLTELSHKFANSIFVLFTGRFTRKSQSSCSNICQKRQVLITIDSHLRIPLLAKRWKDYNIRKKWKRKRLYNKSYICMWMLIKMTTNNAS